MNFELILPFLRPIEPLLLDDGISEIMGIPMPPGVNAAHNYRHFDHGYAVTSHSAQGLTAEHVLVHAVHADTAVHPDLLNSRFAYVSLSRASHEATLFTDNMKTLAPQLSTDISKTSALEIGQTSTLAQGLGMGF